MTSTHSQYSPTPYVEYEPPLDGLLAVMEETSTLVNVKQRKKRVPKAQAGIKKSKLHQNKPRPTELLRTAFPGS